ncbi:hypothetical protein RJ640_029347 [Escallonia rubra]|uniref:Thaumatin-like protein n=1 Tax=Escallonia rubra TaxID=112253 RepID=A0AA88RQY5_9ASTE|nr:hypothetical protein RJ640_029347 [Escallonia rubra]
MTMKRGVEVWQLLVKNEERAWKASPGQPTWTVNPSRGKPILCLKLDQGEIQYPSTLKPNIPVSYMKISPVALALLLLHVIPAGVYSAKLNLANECSYKIWPVLASGGGKTPLSAPALALQPGKSTTVSLPASSSGRLWGRTFCNYNSSIGRLSCLTGDCGSGLPECGWAGALPPVTMVSFELNGDDGLDWYVVRASRGYNLGILVVPQGGSGGACMAAGCVSDVDAGCESETGGACNGTCFAFSDSKHCCTVSYGQPDTCKPSPYSLYSKSRCPGAYGYVYGNRTRGFPCASGDYTVTFCPRPVSLKVSGGATSKPSGAKSKIVVVIVLVVVTTVVVIVLILLKILGPGLAVAIASAVYTALALLFAFI